MPENNALAGPRRGQITSRQALITALRDAAELEHQIMCQYLYAAFSLKKAPDASCHAAQWEYVRRWGATLLLLARQEMEHLALVNNLLLAVGAPPHFTRDNIEGKILSHYHSWPLHTAGPDEPAPVEIHFQFEKFSIATLQRFVCLESPRYQHLHADHMPRWCFTCADAAVSQAVPENAVSRRTRSHLQEAGAGSVEELYDKIRTAFNELPDLFRGDPRKQPVIPSEYDIYVFPVTDSQSANTAIDLIVKQGEGITALPSYSSHFLRLFEIHKELEQALEDDAHFQPALPVLTHPAREKIRHTLTLQAFDLFNDTYVTMLYMLTGFYSHFMPEVQERYPYYSTVLQQTIFAPLMTMFLRPLSEVLAQLKTGDGQETCGPNYYIASDEEARLLTPNDPDFQDINFFLERCVTIRDRLANLYQLRQQEEGVTDGVGRQLEYMYHNAYRLVLNLQHIYQVGKYPKF